MVAAEIEPPDTESGGGPRATLDRDPRLPAEWVADTALYLLGAWNGFPPPRSDRLQSPFPWATDADERRALLDQLSASRAYIDQAAADFNSRCGIGIEWLSAKYAFADLLDAKFIDDEAGPMYATRVRDSLVDNLERAATTAGAVGVGTAEMPGGSTIKAAHRARVRIEQLAFVDDVVQARGRLHRFEQLLYSPVARFGRARSFRRDIRFALLLQPFKLKPRQVAALECVWIEPINLRALPNAPKGPPLCSFPWVPRNNIGAFFDGTAAALRRRLAPLARRQSRGWDIDP